VGLGVLYYPPWTCPRILQATSLVYTDSVGNTQKERGRMGREIKGAETHEFKMAAGRRTFKIYIYIYIIKKKQKNIFLIKRSF
jgi:hypothetical protein